MNLSNETLVPASLNDEWAVRIANKPQLAAKGEHFLRRMHSAVINFVRDLLIDSGRLLVIPRELESYWTEAMKPYSELYRKHNLPEPVWTRALADDRLALRHCCGLLSATGESAHLSQEQIQADRQYYITWLLERVIRQDLRRREVSVKLPAMRPSLAPEIFYPEHDEFGWNGI